MHTMTKNIALIAVWMLSGASGIAAAIASVEAFSAWSISDRTRLRSTIGRIQPLAMGSGDSYYNPIEQETAEEQETRMKLVRGLQKTFYQDAEGARVPELVKNDAEPNTDSSVVQNLPIFRAQWTEFPGSQTVLNVKVPAYTNMFQRLLKGQSKEWSDYDHDSNGGDDMELGAEEPSLSVADPSICYFGHVFSPGDDENADELKEGDVGTLMKIADSRQQKDGQMTLVVQAVEKFVIKRVDRSNPSYVAADVTILPDSEQLLEIHPDTWNTSINTDENDGNNSNNNSNKRNIQTARGAAAKYALANHFFEYKDVSIDDCATTGECEITNDGETVGMAVSPLSNYDPPRQPLVPNEELDLRTQSNSYRDIVAVAESDAWIQLDRLLALLIASGNCVEFPVPTQILSLLPVSRSVLVDGAVQKTSWPESFGIRGIVREMKDYVLDRDECDVVEDEAFCDLFGYTMYYSPLRRAQRMSYVILTWMLTDESNGLAKGISEMDGISREEILGIESTRERLELATARMTKICELMK